MKFTICNFEGHEQILRIVGFKINFAYFALGLLDYNQKPNKHGTFSEEFSFETTEEASGDELFA